LFGGDVGVVVVVVVVVVTLKRNLLESFLVRLITNFMNLHFYIKAAKYR